MAKKPSSTENADPVTGEIVETSPQVPATISERALTVGGMTFTLTKNVVVPHLKQVDGIPVAIKMQRPYIKKPDREEQVLNKETNAAETKKTIGPHMIRVTDLVDGVTKDFIVTAAFKSALDEEYPDNSYVGKCFAAIKHPSQEGKRTKPVQIIEIADPSAA